MKQKNSTNLKILLNNINSFIRDFFSTKNDINEQAVIGFIVLIYILIAFACGLITTIEILGVWLAFDAALWGINLKRVSLGSFSSVTQEEDSKDPQTEELEGK